MKKNNNIKIIEDSFQAFLVEGAEFTSTEEYPIIREDMISKEIPIKIMPFNKAINCREDLSNVFICSYSPDASTERVRRNPKKYLNFFKRTAGIIGFDFSVHSDMPIVKQKSQMNDNLSLTYFYGNNGVPLIPNLRCGDDELLPEYLQTIPKNSIVAVGTHGFIKEKQEKYEWFCFLETVIEQLEPKVIIVYGTLNGKIFDQLKERTSFVFYDAWIVERHREVNRDGN